MYYYILHPTLTDSFFFQGCPILDDTFYKIEIPLSFISLTLSSFHLIHTHGAIANKLGHIATHGYDLVVHGVHSVAISCSIGFIISSKVMGVGMKTKDENTNDTYSLRINTY